MINDRSSIYRFLSIGFTYPQEGFNEILQKSIEMMSHSYTSLNKHGYKIFGIKNLRNALGELATKKLDEWQGIYTSLFISGYPSTPLHPYESFYKEGLLVSESTDQVNQIYKDCGIEIVDNKEFPDFIIFEMEFASFLIENQEGCLPVFQQFFFEHLFSWIFKFFDDVINFEETPLFYQSLARIGSSFLKKEQKILGDLVNEH